MADAKKDPCEEPKMGETQEVLSGVLDEAFSEEPKTETVVETETPVTPAPDVTEPQETEEAVQETETTTDPEEGNRLDPLFGRLKDVSPNDREMISRHYEKANERDSIQEKFEEAERRIAELEGIDTFTKQADRIFNSVKDPRTIQNHEEFRATHTDQEYVLAVERQKAEDQYRDPPPEEDPKDKLLREMEYRLEQIEKGNQTRVAEEGKTLLKTHTLKALGELKVPEKYHEFLSAIIIDARNASTTPVNTYDQLRKLAGSKWGAFEPHLKSKETATKAAIKAKTTPVGKEPPEPVEDIQTDDLAGIETSTELLGKTLDRAMDHITPDGGAD